MKQAVTTEIGKVIIIEVPYPILGKEEAIIAIKSIGICFSDIAPYKGKMLDVFPLPYVMGHEFAGIIKEIDSKSNKFKIGDKVAVFPALNCGECFYCKNKIESLCPNQLFYGTPKKSGALSEFIEVPTQNLVKLEDSFKMEHAGLIEPAAVAYHTIGKYRNLNVLIIGVGAIGSIMCEILKYNNCKAIGIDIDKKALDSAKKFGADLVLNIKDKDLQNKLYNYLGNRKIDIVVLTHINQHNLDLAVEVVRKGGKIIEMASPEENYLLNFKKLYFKAIKLVGNICYSRNEFIEALKLIEKGIINVEKIITKTFPFDEVADAFKYKVNNFALKVLIIN